MVHLPKEDIVENPEAVFSGCQGLLHHVCCHMLSGLNFHVGRAHGHSKS